VVVGDHNETNIMSPTLNSDNVRDSGNTTSSSTEQQADGVSRLWKDGVIAIVLVTVLLFVGGGIEVVSS